MIFWAWELCCVYTSLEPTVDYASFLCSQYLYNSDHISQTENNACQ